MPTDISSRQYICGSTRTSSRGPHTPGLRRSRAVTRTFRKRRFLSPPASPTTVRLAPAAVVADVVVGTLAGGEAFAERIVTAAGDVLTGGVDLTKLRLPA